MITLQSRTSNAHYVNGWRRFAQRSKSGECREAKGILLAWSGVGTPFLNVALLTKPVRGAADLEERAQFAVEYATAKKLLWMFPICQDFIPTRLRPKQDAILAKFGLKPVEAFSGMLADHIKRPVRALPTDIEFRSFRDVQARYDNAVLNVQCYGMPDAWGRDVVDQGALCTPDEYGCTGYLDGKPVTSAMAMPLDGWLYVALVATREEHRKKGYAEAAMRYCLEAASKATGIQRSSLHSTESGYRLYQQMGYRDVSKFVVYAVAE